MEGTAKGEEGRASVSRVAFPGISRVFECLPDQYRMVGV